MGCFDLPHSYIRLEHGQGKLLVIPIPKLTSGISHTNFTYFPYQL